MLITGFELKQIFATLKILSEITYTGGRGIWQDSRITAGHSVTRWYPRGNKRRARPKKRWVDSLKKILWSQLNGCGK